jgi:hypothetical protein
VDTSFPDGSAREDSGALDPLDSDPQDSESAPEVDATGLVYVDQLHETARPSVADYIVAVSEYVRERTSLSEGKAKAAQIRLSKGLGRALLGALEARLPGLDAFAGEKRVAGALRTVNADVSESHHLDGLRLAVEIKPTNLAVGRALWNRFGDIRTFAVNIHLKFPFCVVGGVLVIPTHEATPTGTRDVTHLITRAVERLVRAGGRRSEADAAHLLEGVCVLVYDAATGLISEAVPPPGHGLRWDEFVDEIATTYEARFE